MHFLFVSDSLPTDSVKIDQTVEPRQDWMDWG